ncbi:ABC transporter permease [Paenibacillus xylaniclasticus]|uniref:ABC transporter permease n=1 Tax=Paenibacillus xylaniclasticus TaxID=588083 RepID=UPI000FD9EDCB|nr:MULTISPECIES: FtsX-like permease family protein [Paenibacillus]GFN33061.1 ABC transporter permease YtrF [Paenibacillus curdlanolyticus]
MRMKDRFRFVRQNMGKNKSRIALTVLATSMGCTFLIMIASVAFGLQKSIVDDMLHGRTVTQIEINARAVNADRSNPRPVAASDIEALHQSKHIKAVTAAYAAQGKWELEGGYTSEGMIAVSNMAEEIKSELPLSEGRLPQAADEAVVGYHFAQSLINEDGQAYNGTLIGTTLTTAFTVFPPESGDNVQERTEVRQITIVGIRAKPTKEITQDYSYLVDQALFESSGFLADQDPAAVTVFVKSANKVNSVAKALRAEGFLIYSVADELKEIDIVFLIMKIGLIFVGTIAVIIASIGIYNTMTMAVTERAPDIGIMKAIGAHPRTIRSVFLLESFGIGIVGAVIGTAAAYVLSMLVNAIVPPIVHASLDSSLPDGFVFSYIPWTLTVLSVVISAGVAILSGLRPAARATGIDVLRALRRDL